MSEEGDSGAFDGAGDGDDGPEVKIETAPFDPRFPNMNQTKHCFTSFLDYHRCIKVWKWFRVREIQKRIGTYLNIVSHTNIVLHFISFPTMEASCLLTTHAAFAASTFNQIHIYLNSASGLIFMVYLFLDNNF